MLDDQITSCRFDRHWAHLSSWRNMCGGYLKLFVFYWGGSICCFFHSLFLESCVIEKSQKNNECVIMNYWNFLNGATPLWCVHRILICETLKMLYSILTENRFSCDNLMLMYSYIDINYKMMGKTNMNIYLYCSPFRVDTTSIKIYFHLKSTI